MFSGDPIGHCYKTNAPKLKSDKESGEERLQPPSEENVEMKGVKRKILRYMHKIAFDQREVLKKKNLKVGCFFLSFEAGEQVAEILTCKERERDIKEKERDIKRER